MKEESYFYCHLLETPRVAGRLSIHFCSLRGENVFLEFESSGTVKTISAIEHPHQIRY